MEGVVASTNKDKAELLHQQIDRVLRLLKNYAGFTPSSSLRYKLEKIFSRIDQKVLSSWIDQLHLASSYNELNALVEDLTNHETFFFREKIQLDVFFEDLLPALIAEKIKNRDYTIRIWSAASSTGEEVYTLTILTLCAMVKAGIARELEPGKITLANSWNLEVFGTDISRQALKIAENAIYLHKPDKLHSFRSFPEKYKRFFNAIGETDKTTGISSFQVNESVRRHVKFSWFNLKSPTAIHQNMDFIFCRNVLIYFDKADHAEVQSMLAKALTQKGCLFLGLVDNLAASCQLKVNRQYRCTFYES